jgi:4-diphosphocytidyl-2-C-methyl-D-erythritol kinase
MQETAYAKLNLALHVRERRPDGYHRIETVFAFCEAGDLLRVENSEELTLAIEGEFASSLTADDDNLVLRAARALQARFGAGGAHLVLDKRLPVAAGIGGGSADAAAALRLLTRWWDLDPEPSLLRALAAKLGADVIACLLSRPARGEGRGDQLVPFADGELAGAPVLLLNPRVELSTAQVFRAWDGEDRGPLGDWRDGRNDLEAAARRLVPEVAEMLEALAGARFVRMSGSGATCFGLYSSESERDSAAAAIASGRPDWWLLATRLRGT